MSRRHLPRAIAALAALAGISLALAPAADAGFASARGFTFGTGGTRPVSLAAADFNSDGKADLAVANHDSDNVAVLLGDARGALSPSIVSPLSTGSTGAISVVTQDFNLDGAADIAVAYNQSGNLSVLLGDGRGGFTIVPVSAYNLAPVSIAPGDFNGDHKPDLAVVRAGNAVSVVLGDGGGVLTVVSTTGTGGVGANGLATADFNRDGKLDVAVPNVNSGDVSVLAGDGRGGLGAVPGSPFGSGGSFPNSVATGDFNGDVKPDVAVTNHRTGDVSVLLGDGRGGLAPATGSPFASGGFHPVSIAAGDVSGDRKIDVAVASSSGDVSVLLGDGRGVLHPASGSPFVSGGFHPTSIGLADVNGDGRLDLAVTNSSGDVSVLRNKGNVVVSSRCRTLNRAVTMSRRGMLGLRATCPFRASAKLTLRTRKGHVRLGSKRFRVSRAGRTVIVRVRLSSNGQRLIQRRKRIRASATVTARRGRGRHVIRSSNALTIRVAHG